MSSSRLQQTILITRAFACAALAFSVIGCDRDPPVAVTNPPPGNVQPAAQPASPPAPEVAAARQAATDAALAARVKEALVAQGDTNARGIDVVANNGVVTLFGTSFTPEQRKRALTIAAAVPGVKTVESRLKIVAGS